MNKDDKFKTKLYDKLQDVDRGISTPEQALNELVKELDGGLLLNSSSSSKDLETYPNGLYKIHWKSGGWSYASVGRDLEGKPWLAPTNWINGSVMLEDKLDMIETATILYLK